MEPGRDRNSNVDSAAFADDDCTESQARALRQLVERAGDFLFTVDVNGTVQYVDDGVESVLGYDPEAVVGEPVETLLATDVTEETTVSTLTGGGAESERSVSFLADDGTVVYTAVSTAPLTDGDGVLCLVRDVTDHRERDRELSRYAELVETVGDPMCVLDRSGTIEQVNDAMVEYTGYSEDDLVGRSITELTSSTEHDRIRGLLAHFDSESSHDGHENDGSETFETTLVTSDGELVLIEANITVLRDDRGQVVGSVGVLRDIRQRKRREQDLDLLKQVLTRVFRHNIRNELMVVQGYTDVIESTVEADIDEPVSEIHAALESLLGYSEKAREIEKVMESPHRQDVSLAHEIQRAVDTVEGTHPNAQVDVAERPRVTVRAHPKIAVAIRELLDNALRHTPEDREPAVRLWTDEQDETLTLFIEDNAGGLADSEVAVLRRGTESNLEHSSGVGLWLVRWVVEYSGAELIPHRTEDGTLMAIRFRTGRAQPDSATDPSALPPTVSVREPAALDPLSPTTVVGRLDERHELEGVYESLERAGGHAVFVTGEPGVGKSTLVENFLDDAIDTDLVGTASCERGLTPPYDTVMQALSDLPVEATATDLAGDAGVVDRDPEGVRNRRQELFADIAAELRELATDQPLVLVLEDLHWADRETVEFVEFLIDEVVRWAPPVLIVGTSRTTEAGESDALASLLSGIEDAGRQTVIELDPLEPADVEQVLEQLLELESVPTQFVDAVYSHTGGTPLFVTELARHFAELSGPQPEPERLPTAFDDVAVPESVDRAVTARLDALFEPLLSVLELGAIVGDTVSLDILLEASDLPAADVLEYVNRLVDRRLWEQTGDQFRFVHGVVRQEALDRLDDGRRRSLHERVAAAIEDVYADSLDEQYGRLASQYEQAGDLVTAFEYSRRAGEHASSVFAYETAAEHYETALSLAETDGVGTDEAVTAIQGDIAVVLRGIGEYERAYDYVHSALDTVEEPETNCALLATLTDLHLDQGEYEQAKQHGERLQERAAAVADHSYTVEALEKLGSIALHQGAFETATEQFETALDSTDDPSLRGGILLGLGTVAYRTGEFESAHERYRRALEHKRQIDDYRGEARCLLGLGIVADRRGEFEAATEYYQQALEYYRRVGDRHGEARVLGNLGIVAMESGDFDAAERSYQRSLEIFQRLGARHDEARNYNNLGEVARRREEYERAHERFDRAIDSYREVGDGRGEANTLAHLGAIEGSLEQYESARDYLDRAFELYDDLGVESGVATVELERARLLLSTGALERARERTKQLVDRFDDLGDRRGVGQSFQLLGRIAADAGEYETAREHWQQADDIFAELGMVPGQLQTLRYLTETARDVGDTSTARTSQERARELLSDAPPAMVERHESWVDN